MKKTAYEKLLKRIDSKNSKNSAKIDSRFELPPVDVMWEGQRTYLRNFSDFPKIRLLWDIFIFETNVSISLPKKGDEQWNYNR